jgi:hypothetical protein
MNRGTEVVTSIGRFPLLVGYVASGWLAAVMQGGSLLGIALLRLLGTPHLAPGHRVFDH